MIIKTCLFCNKETTNPKFCSRSCSAKETNKIPKRTIKRKCSKCENLIRNTKSSLCEKHFKEDLENRKEHILNLSLKDYTERECIKKLHKSSKHSHIRGLCRSWNKSKTKLPCHVCGYTKHVELAHIKSISSFSEDAKLSEVNSSDNIIQLCPNCHWEFDNGLIILDFPEQSESH